jgi:uncharacterized protein (DUF1800 family)
VLSPSRSIRRRIGASPELISREVAGPFVSQVGSLDCAPVGGKSPNGCKRETGLKLQQDWIGRLTFGPTPLEDRLIQLWLGIFPVNWNQLGNPHLLVLQIETIRAHLNGTYPELLGAMVADAALQISLDGLHNHRQSPNENLSRELLELFSLGQGNYVERDVVEAARALTGYRLQNDGSLSIDPRRHDEGPKTILGRTAAFDGPSLVEWLGQQPATAQNITSRIWLQLVGSQPPTRRIAAIARDWQKHNLSIPWLIETLLFSPEAAASIRAGDMLRDPIDLMVASLALIGSHHPDAFVAARLHLGRMGQVPFEPPSVKGWPVNDQWLKRRGLQARRRGLQALLADAEVWASRSLPDQLISQLTPIPPITLSLPAKPSRDTLAQLFNDPVWQLK